MCDELKEYYYYEDRVVTPATHMYRVYHADKVDTAIAELKQKLAEEREFGLNRPPQSWCYTEVEA